MHQGSDGAVHHREALRSPLPSVALPPLRAVEVLDQLRERVRLLHYSRRTEEACVVHWCRALIRFHGIRHHRELGSPEVEAFLNWLANERRVAASTHKQVLLALNGGARVLLTGRSWRSGHGRDCEFRAKPGSSPSA